MKTYFYSVFCVLMLLCLTACGEEEGPEAPACGSRTVLVYMAADNNLLGFAHDDLEEMKQGMQQVSSEDVHFLVYMDFGNVSRLVELRNQDGRVKEVLVKEYPLPRNSIGLAETAEVFSDAFRTFPAESYGLIYWSHGDGWIPANVSTKWIGQDSRHGFMNLSDFVLALQKVPHLDFLLFDACFMQGIEVAYELRQFTDALVCSPTETPAPGGPYQQIVPAMFAQEPACKIAAAYYDYYDYYYVDPAGVSGSQGGGWPYNSEGDWISGLSMAVVRTDALEQLAQITKQCLAHVEGVDIDALSRQVFDYDKRKSAHCGYYDLWEMMNVLLSPSDFKVWDEAVRQVCVYWKSTSFNYSGFAGMFPMDKAHGVSHYIPANLSSSASRAYRQTAWYQAAGLSQLGW